MVASVICESAEGSVEAESDRGRGWLGVVRGASVICRGGGTVEEGMMKGFAVVMMKCFSVVKLMFYCYPKKN